MRGSNRLEPRGTPGLHNDGRLIHVKVHVHEVVQQVGTHTSSM